MATRKVLFVLSLALLINPALHCMEDTENSNKELTALGFGLLSLTAAIYITNKLLIKPKKKKLLHESQNVEVFTSRRLRGSCSYDMFEETGTQLGIYGIFNTSKYSMFGMDNILKTSSYSIEFTKNDPDTLHKGIVVNNRLLLNILYKKIINVLLPNWYELLRGKDKYNLDDDKKITEAIRSCMQTMNIDGSVVLMTPPDTRSKGLLGGVVERKTLVVHSKNSDCRAFCFFADWKYETYSQLEEIKQGTFRCTDKDLSGHIILATKNIPKNRLEEALKNDSVFSNDLGEFIPRTSDVRKEINQYQQNIINQVFPENDGSGPEEGKAILMIPLQNSYHELKVKE